MSIKRALIRLIAKKPTERLNWSVDDFKKAKLWAMGQPHPDPMVKNKSLWDYVNQTRMDSIEIIHEINKFI